MKFKVGDKVRFVARTQTQPWPMTVLRIDGSYVYLDNVASVSSGPWHEGNLMLDSEWKADYTVPVIERGIPMPPISHPRPRQAKRKDRAPSKWIAFLQSLKVGDSFLVEYPEVRALKAHARRLSINLTWRRSGNGPNGLAQERLWRVE
jgi:hypothetical protein